MTLATIVEADVARSVPAGLTTALEFRSGRPEVLIGSGCNTGSGQVVDGRLLALTTGQRSLVYRAG